MKPLSKEEIEDVVNWAISASALIVLMQNSPRADTVASELGRLQGYDEVIGVIHDNIPNSIIEPASEIAQEAVSDAIKTESLVEQFKQELDEL